MLDKKEWKREYGKKYRQSDSYKKYRREYRARNKEKLKEQDRLSELKRRRLNPERYRKKWRSKNLLRRYGLTLEQYEEMVVKQQNKCAICGAYESALHYQKKCPQRLAIDHNHNSGKVRGLLCFSCNRALGYFKDSGDLLISALLYLEENDG